MESESSQIPSQTIAEVMTLSSTDYEDIVSEIEEEIRASSKEKHQSSQEEKKIEQEKRQVQEKCLEQKNKSDYEKVRERSPKKALKFLFGIKKVEPAPPSLKQKPEPSHINPKPQSCMKKTVRFEMSHLNSDKPDLQESKQCENLREEEKQKEADKEESEKQQSVKAVDLRPILKTLPNIEFVYSSNNFGGKEACLDCLEEAVLEEELLCCISCRCTIHEDCLQEKLISLDWRCPRCIFVQGEGTNLKAVRERILQAKCAFCSQFDGFLKFSDRYKWYHENCELWMPVDVKNRVSDSVQPVKWSSKFECMYCKSKTGKTKKCDRRRCNKYFHPWCAMKRGTIGDLSLLDEIHTRKQKALFFCCYDLKRITSVYQKFDMSHVLKFLANPFPGKFYQKLMSPNTEVGSSQDSSIYSLTGSVASSVTVPFREQETSLALTYEAGKKNSLNAKHGTLNSFFRVVTAQDRCDELLSLLSLPCSAPVEEVKSTLWMYLLSHELFTSDQMNVALVKSPELRKIFRQKELRIYDIGKEVESMFNAVKIPQIFPCGN